MTGAAIIIDRSQPEQVGRIDAIVPTPPSTAQCTLQDIAPAALIAPMQSLLQGLARRNCRRHPLHAVQSP